jgi:hypothetical protein
MNPNEIKEQPDPIDVLVQKYPSVFKDMDSNVLYDLPSGWVKLFDDACIELSVILEEERKRTPETPDNPLFVPLQIKEKFGGLRFYYTMNTENDDLVRTVQRLIDSAEDKSYTVCEVTGKPGEFCKSGWHFKTLCEELRIKHGFKLIGPKEFD